MQGTPHQVLMFAIRRPLGPSVVINKPQSTQMMSGVNLQINRIEFRKQDSGTFIFRATQRDLELI